mmetsp:Transcript_27821/g.42801  ORF Transcript_27821/g.42801 Transcript_27821/m.42801 type:complete len:171 (+) Transcript_27821:68-580(+)|eukprot:CAMPEP_0118702582 /NCGR_PEP_ID=MMETSP0800-20121206/17976_1 /TAXON_ID=210618 ORGANISM="Striatella unipunctata, Strain CCMP2910" /NCGR_SAMPLE_ID=MMETSP0800 /ASSEMBLY_ACC=CAM_ASM_000638 /LENGTH=170 /DNA_ID=CAMNT_0006603809 /DNA_START=41 /DNA_END=553 /DNA_ORIENTATION=+
MMECAVSRDFERSVSTLSTGLDSTSTDGERSVRFGTIEIYEHPIILGDNPSVSAGLPITIDWDSQREFCFSIEDYEDYRLERRRKDEMSIPAEVREEILANSGLNRSNAAAAMREVGRTKKQRRRTNDTLHMAKMEEAGERMKRAVKNALFSRKAKKSEREYLEMSVSRA